MEIVGLESVVFAVDDIDACASYLDDVGLIRVELSADGGRYEAQDGSSVVFRRSTDSMLAVGCAPVPALRETVYGVVDDVAMMRIADELSRDRAVRLTDDGVVHALDDSGLAIAFQRSERRLLTLPAELVNAPGSPVQRRANQLGMDVRATVVPRSLSQIGYFVPNVAKAEKFYAGRLGFRTTDRVTGVGRFMRPSGTQDHHTLLLLQSPNPHMNGLHHFSCRMAGPSELMLAGSRFTDKGYQGYWGPGRHILGSNYFWYFNSPFGGLMQYDADMDVLDDSWQPRELAAGADTSQGFLFSHRAPWAPGA